MSCYVSFISSVGNVQATFNGTGGSATASNRCPVPYITCSFDASATSTGSIDEYLISGNHVSVISVF